MSAEHSLVAEDLFLSGKGRYFISIHPLTTSSIIFFQISLVSSEFSYIHLIPPPSSLVFLFTLSNEIFLSAIQRGIIHFPISPPFTILTNVLTRREDGERENFSRDYATGITDASSQSRIRKTDTNRDKKNFSKYIKQASAFFFHNFPYLEPILHRVYIPRILRVEQR